MRREEAESVKTVKDMNVEGKRKRKTEKKVVGYDRGLLLIVLSESLGQG